MRKAEVENWPGYLRWLATHRAIDRLRARRRTQSRFNSGDMARFKRPIAEPAKTAQLNELVGLVRTELVGLPTRQAEAFWLVCVEEMTTRRLPGIWKSTRAPSAS